MIFVDISGPFLASLLSKSWMLLYLLFLRFLRYLSWVFLASKKNPCYFCYFCDICGHFGPFLASFFSRSWFLLHLLFLRYLSWVFSGKKNPCYFCDFRVMGVFRQEKSLLLLRFSRYLGTFRGPSWLLFFSKSGILLHLLFCDICDICHGCFQLAGKILVTFAIFAIFGDISGPFLASFFFLSLEFCCICYFCDICDICHGCF